MEQITRIRPKYGDIIEIRTPAGLAYAQYTHRHIKPPKYGALLRVLPGLFATRPSDFTELVQQKERFLVFFPLGAACNRGIVRIVDQQPIPPWSQSFPVFRDGNADASGHIEVWYLWDGEREWRVGKLTPEQEKLPRNPGVWNDTILIERIVEGWKPKG